MNFIFFSIISVLFILSFIASIMYFNKIYTVLRYHKADPAIYMKYAFPAV
jgi:hypothetical protein